MRAGLLLLLQIRELGRGCFGSVWLAKWKGVEVALKEQLAAIGDAASDDCFNEAERLASLRHPCVTAFYGVVLGGGGLGMVLEYVKMGSLSCGLRKLKEQVCEQGRR
jgi:serine/threonine protein kinase